MKWEEKFLRRFENTANEYIDTKDIEIGKVISIEPLQITSEKLVLYKENLYVNPELLAHKKEFETLTGTVGDNSITISNGSISFVATLKEGDMVALKPIRRDKTYLVMFKIE